MKVVGTYKLAGGGLSKVSGIPVWSATLETPDEIEYAQRDLGLTPYQVEGEDTLCAYVSEHKAEVEAFAEMFRARGFETG